MQDHKTVGTSHTYSLQLIQANSILDLMNNDAIDITQKSCGVLCNVKWYTPEASKEMENMLYVLYVYS